MKLSVVEKAAYIYRKVQQKEITIGRTTNNIARTYQQFCDRNLGLRRREDELQRTIDELEAKKTKLNESLSEFEESNMDKENFNLEVKQEEDVISMINVLTQHPNMTVDYPGQ